MFIDFRERKKHQLVAPTRDQTHKLGVCPDWGVNPQPFAVQYDTPNNQATVPVLKYLFKGCILGKWRVITNEKNSIRIILEDNIL